MSRRFMAGQRFQIGAIHLRVEPGYKKPRGPGEDLRLELLTESGWIPIRFALAALIADFAFENEDVLYPPPRYLGGDKFAAYIVRAMTDGWEVAEAVLQREKRQR